VVLNTLRLSTQQKGVGIRALCDCVTVIVEEVDDALTAKLIETRGEKS